jgi:transposase-like protein
MLSGKTKPGAGAAKLLLDLKRRGLAMGPELAVADGALGFWQAVEEVWPRTHDWLRGTSALIRFMSPAILTDHNANKMDRLTCKIYDRSVRCS